MPVELSALRGRQEFGCLLNDLGLVNWAVEIGTHQGQFAEILLQDWVGRRLHCVDPYISGYDREDPASVGDREKDFKQAQQRLAPFGGRVVFMRRMSIDAAPKFKNNSLDFVYVDGCHQYRSVLEDLNVWYPKLRVGGILAGHDIYSGVKPGEGWDRFVNPAVTWFARKVQLTVYFVPEMPRINWSYFMVKNQLTPPKRATCLTAKFVKSQVTKFNKQR